MIKYLITDPKYYTNNPQKFTKILTDVLNNHNINMICFRDKTSSNFEQLAKITLDIAKKYNIEKILLNGNISLAKKLGFDGVHLQSTQYSNIKDAKKYNLFTIISCHTFEDIKQAQTLDANMVTFSPIFDTPNKGESQGIKVLNNMINEFDIPIIALGGIVTKWHIEQLEKYSIKAYASIRYFVNEYDKIQNID